MGAGLSTTPETLESQFAGFFPLLGASKGKLQGFSFSFFLFWFLKAEKI